MKIRILASGEVRHIDNSTGGALISAGLAELISKSDNPLPGPGDYRPPQVEWSVVVMSPETEINLAGRQLKWLAIRRDVKRPLVSQQAGKDGKPGNYQVGGGFTDSSFCSLPPDFVHNKRYANGGAFCSAFGCPVPDEILKEYKRQWKANPDLRFPYEGRPAPNRPDEKADRAAVETFVENTARTGVAEGEALLRRPGPRT